MLFLCRLYSIAVVYGRRHLGERLLLLPLRTSLEERGGLAASSGHRVQLLLLLLLLLFPVLLAYLLLLTCYSRVLILCVCGFCPVSSEFGVFY